MYLLLFFQVQDFEDFDNTRSSGALAILERWLIDGHQELFEPSAETLPVKRSKD